MAKDISIIVKAVDQVTKPITDMNSRIKGFAEGITSCCDASAESSASATAIKPSRSTSVASPLRTIARTRRPIALPARDPARRRMRA